MYAIMFSPRAGNTYLDLLDLVMKNDMTSAQILVSNSLLAIRPRSVVISFGCKAAYLFLLVDVIVLI